MSRSRQAWPLITALLFLGGLLSGCAAQPSEPRPPEIIYGQEACEACGMLISEPKFAAATLTADGQTRKFDDIGDMIDYQAKHPAEQVRAWFVHDYHSEGWLRGETAAFVVSPQIKTPMGHGIAAFSDSAAAQAFAQPLGSDAKVSTLADLRQAPPMNMP